jgi:hypothetical protein
VIGKYIGFYHYSVLKQCIAINPGFSIQSKKGFCNKAGINRRTEIAEGKNRGYATMEARSSKTLRSAKHT